jgi:hypothetical protein
LRNLLSPHPCGEKSLRILKKISRIALRVFLGLLGCIVVFLIFAIGRVDRTPASEFEGYKKTFQEVDQFNFKINIPQDSLLLVGFSKINLTPAEPVALAGYGNRKGKHYTKVADSVFVRTMVIDNGVSKIAIVTADLLLIPPKVTETLQKKLPSIGFSIENVFLGATHTHNSIGNWGEGAAGFIYGAFDEEMIDFIAYRIIESVQGANKRKVQSRLKFGKVSNSDAVENRLIKGGPEDPYLRLLEVQRDDSVKLLLMTYSAHATCLYSRDLELSADYPGKLVSEVEKSGYDFAMFMAGAVGSHKPAAPKSGWVCFDWMADELLKSIHQSKEKFVPVKNSTISTSRIQLHLSDPQVKLSNNFAVRSWVFRTALGEYPVYINTVRVGDLTLMGVPADFSGQFSSSLDSIAALNSINLITTSFNGGYVGYLTPGKYYENKYFETQFMNWYAPGTGEFVSDVMKKILIKHQ